MSEIYFERPYALVSWEPDFQGIFIQIKGFVQGDSLKEVMEKGLELFKSKHAQNWITDLGEQSVSSLVDQEWVAKDFIPRCKVAGVVKYAMVMPQKMIAYLGVNRVLNLTPEGESGAESANFTSVEEAREWILSK